MFFFVFELIRTLEGERTMAKAVKRAKKAPAKKSAKKPARKAAKKRKAA
jgi:hypothetical protein